MLNLLFLAAPLLRCPFQLCLIFAMVVTKRIVQKGRKSTDSLLNSWFKLDVSFPFDWKENVSLRLAVLTFGALSSST